MTQKLIHFITLILLMLITGLFWGTWFSLSRTMETFSVAEFIHIGKTIIRNVATPMKIIMPSCILLMAISMWLYPLKNSMGFYFTVTAFIFLIASLIITLAIEVPIDNQIKTWTPETAPSDWDALRTHWEFFHTVRTFISLASFAFFSAAFFQPFQKKFTMKHHTLKSILLITIFLSAYFFIASFQTANLGNLKVTVIGIRNSTGEINFNLYNKADGFPKEEAKALRHFRGKIANGISSVIFEKVSFGKYAVAVYHDENNNKKLDKNFFGMPTEGASVSNNAKGSISGPPTFDAAKFDFNSQTNVLIIKMNYQYSK